MSYIFLLGKGMIIGFSTAIPLGPIGILCIQQSISNGKRFGLVTGLGAATADMLFGTIAVFSVTVISNFLFDNNDLIRVVGGIILIILGFRMFIKRKKPETIEVTVSGLIQSYLTTFMLTLTNPLTIFAYMTIFTLFSISIENNDVILSSLVVAGIFIGSALWFTLLAQLSTLIKEKMTESKLLRLNQIFGLLILGFGIFLIIRKLAA